MKVGILGTGDVGRSLGKGLIILKHEVRMGSRSADNEKMRAWVKEMGPRASGGTFADAAKFGELIVLATLGVANESAIKMAGTRNFEGKVVIDATNPLDFSGGVSPRLAVGHIDSAGERVQRLLPGARVVKAFNTVGSPHMFRPSFPGGPPDMFMCGNNDEAKDEVRSILKEFGWDTVDLGGIEASRYLEAMCLVWVLHGVRSNSWNHAFKFLHK